MIELALKTFLKRISDMNVYPLLLPDSEQEGITYQRISDPEIISGLLRTGLYDIRMQVSMYLINDYSRLLVLDKQIWKEFQAIVHGQLEGYQVQYVDRAGIQQDSTKLVSGHIQYRLIRDFIFTIAE